MVLLSLYTASVRMMFCGLNPDAETVSVTDAFFRGSKSYEQGESLQTTSPEGSVMVAPLGENLRRMRGQVS